MTVSISAVLIVKNEAHVIERCIESLHGVNEIVILDTGSSDGTQERARQAGARVVELTPPLKPFHFAEARNKANALAENDWVLVLDADEILHAGSLKALRKTIEKDPELTAVKTPFIMRAEGTDRTMLIKKVKCFRRSAYEWRYRVHEQLRPLGEEKVVFIDGATVEHRPPEEKAKRHAQNIELLQLCVKETPEYTRAWRHLGQELMLQNRPEEAIPKLKRYLKDTKDNEIDKSQVACYIAQAYTKLKRIKEAIEFYACAVTIAPFRREPIFWGARLLYENRRFDEAVQWLEKCLEIPVDKKPGSNYDEDEMWGNMPLEVLAIIKQQIAEAKAKLAAR